jgi:hypothetical protein
MRAFLNVETATDDVSTGEPVRTWATTYQSEPATYTPTTGGEQVNGRMVEPGIQAIFTMHRRESISTEQRILHAGQYYGIVYVHPVEGGLRYIDLHCRAIKTQ